MVRFKSNKKLLALLFVFFGEIIISLSGQSSDMEKDPGVSGYSISSRLNNEISSFSGVSNSEDLVEDFLENWDITGASVAVAQNEKLIYAKGFGYTDTTTKEVVQPKHLFRIASISKLITSVAIMHLKEEGEINLKEHVFGKKGILNNPEFLEINDPRIKQITVEHLLTHSGGWSKHSGDPVFMPYTIKDALDTNLPVELEDVIEYTLKYRTLDFDPGTAHSYSNFGYAVLGKVIEKLTGRPYEQYVTSEILNPIGIYDMHMGESRLSGKYPNEVTYYANSKYTRSYSSFEEGKIVPRQYGGNNMEVLGAAGAWIASPAELLKLIVHIDGLKNKKDILSAESIERMIEHDENLNPIGWVSTNGNGIWKRTGTLTGTSALLKRNNNGMSWVILLNTSNDKGPDFTKDLDSLMSRFIRRAEGWPDYDLFTYANPKPLFSYSD